MILWFYDLRDRQFLVGLFFLQEKRMVKTSPFYKDQITRWSDHKVITTIEKCWSTESQMCCNCKDSVIIRKVAKKIGKYFGRHFYASLGYGGVKGVD